MRSIVDLKDLFEQRFDGINIDVEEVDGKLSVNDRIAFPVQASKAFERSNSIPLEDGLSNVVGTIYFLKGIKVDVAQIPFDQYLAFLDEFIEPHISSSEYTFKSDYLVIDKAFFPKYKSDFKETSSLWGSFFHKEDLPNIHFSKAKMVNKLVVRENLIIERSFYKENIAIAIAEQNPFTRFLKYYHLLEVHFDMHTAEKLKKMIEDGNREKEISKTLKDYNREDIERIKSLLINKIDPELLVPFFDEVKNHLPTAISMFYEYGKESNPIKTKKNFDEIIIRGSFSEANVDAVLGNTTFATKIPQIAAYWIYRIRSSIAHNKLGEYLMTAADEDFIIEFAEPLIKEIVIQSYTR